MPVRGCHLERLGSDFGSVAAREHHVPLSGSCSSWDRGQETYFHSESTGRAAALPFLSSSQPLSSPVGTGSERDLRCVAVTELGSIYTSLIQPRPTPGRPFWDGNILPLCWKSSLWQQSPSAGAITFLCLAKVGWKWQWGVFYWFTCNDTESFCLCQPQITAHPTLERHNYARKVCCAGLRGKMWFHFITLEFSH